MKLNLQNSKQIPLMKDKILENIMALFGGFKCRHFIKIKCRDILSEMYLLKGFLLLIQHTKCTSYCI